MRSKRVSQLREGRVEILWSLLTIAEPDSSKSSTTTATPLSSLGCPTTGCCLLAAGSLVVASKFPQRNGALRRKEEAAAPAGAEGDGEREGEEKRQDGG